MYKGILGPDAAFRLHYKGNGCGGCNLPFDSVSDALAYAAQRYGTRARVEHASGRVQHFTRPDARYKWSESNASE